jgi:hypothetical protein
MTPICWSRSRPTTLKIYSPPRGYISGLTSSEGLALEFDSPLADKARVDQIDPYPALARTAIAALIVLVSAAALSRAGVDPAPMLFLLGGLLPQAGALALAVRDASRRERLQRSSLGGSVVRVIAGLVGAAGIYGLMSGAPGALAVLIAAVAIGLVATPHLLVVQNPYNGGGSGHRLRKLQPVPVPTKV